MQKLNVLKNGMHTAINILGYDMKDKKMIINQDEAKIVKFIFKTYLTTKSCYRTSQICNKKRLSWKKRKKISSYKHLCNRTQ